MEVIKFGSGNNRNIKKVEEIFHIKLPEDYKKFLLENNGATIKEAFFYVKDLKQLIMMGVFYGIDLGKENEAIDVIYENKEFQEDVLENSLLIGSDPGGGWLLLVADGENDGIWYYDHSYFFKKSTHKLNTYFIAESFSDFLKMLETTLPPKK